MDFDDIDDSNVDYSQSTNRNNQRDTFYNQPPMIQRSEQLEFQEIEEDDGSNEIRIDSTDENKLEEFLDEDVKVEEETEEPLEIGGTPWKISFYRTFYNVDTKDVLLRISKTFNPFGINFFDLIGNNADLYGWIWISITLTFAIAAMSNVVSYISDYLNDKAGEWTYEFTKVTVGAVTISIYVTVVPVLAWVAYSLWLKFPLNIIQNLCIIGYSIFPYIPCAILMIVPINFVRWGIVLLTCLIVCIFLARNYFPYVKQRPLEGGIVLVFILLCNIILALILQLYFFDYSIPLSAFTSSSPSPTPTPDVTPSITPSLTPSLTPSFSLSPSMDITPSPSPSISFSPSISDTPSISLSSSISIASPTPISTIGSLL